MSSAQKALTKIAEAFHPPLYQSDSIPYPKDLAASYIHPLSPGPFAPKTTFHDEPGRVKVRKNGQKHGPVVETGGDPVDERKTKSSRQSGPRSNTMPDLFASRSPKRSSPDPDPVKSKKVALKKDAWVRETRPKALGGESWEPAYDVLRHLDEMVGEMREREKEKEKDGGGDADGREGEYEIFEGSLLHSLKAETKARRMLERKVEGLEKRVEKLEGGGGGRRGMGHEGGEGEMRDWFARHEQAVVEAREFF